MTSITVHHVVIIGMLVLSTIGTAQQECFNGQVRRFHSYLLEYCYNGEWRLVYYSESQWSSNMTRTVCAQLGYNNIFGIVRGSHQSGAGKFVTLSECNKPGLSGCTKTPSDDNCTECSLVFLQCILGNCDDGEIRLVGGSTDREGRVEVCVGGRWRTVCTGSQELAGAVCSQMGYIFEGGTVAIPNQFLPGGFPEYRLNCTQLSNGAWHCSPVEQQCDSFVELGVICKKYKDLYDECLMNYTMSTISTTVEVTTQMVTNSEETYCTPRATTNNNGSSPLLLAVIILVVLQAATMIALISTCVVFKRKHKQKVTMQPADLTYAVVGGTQTEMKIDPNIAANPAYEVVKCDQEDHTYDVVSEGAASRQRRGN